MINCLSFPILFFFSIFYQKKENVGRVERQLIVFFPTFLGLWYRLFSYAGIIGFNHRVLVIE